MLLHILQQTTLSRLQEQLKYMEHARFYQLQAVLLVKQYLLKEQISDFVQQLHLMQLKPRKDKFVRAGLKLPDSPLLALPRTSVPVVLELATLKY